MLKINKRKLNKLGQGTVQSSTLYVVVFLIISGISAVVLSGGVLPQETPLHTGPEVIISPPEKPVGQKSLQLYTFTGVTDFPTSPPQASLCTDGSVNNEPEILGYPNSSVSTITVTASGQIKVWVNDENPPFVSPNETIDTSTGKITKPGDRTAKAADGYLWEPAIYIAPQTAESGGTPHFPDYIKGSYANNSGGSGLSFNNRGKEIKGPTMDPIPQGGTSGLAARDRYHAEYLWDVSGLGLTTGSHQAEFVIHDGDRDRGVGCVAIVIQ